MVRIEAAVAASLSMQCLSLILDAVSIERALQLDYLLHVGLTDVFITECLFRDPCPKKQVHVVLTLANRFLDSLLHILCQTDS